MSREEQEQNLIVVSAVEGYSQIHHIPVQETLALFIKNKVPDILRSQYEVLHMLDLDESVQYAEAILRRASV